MRQAIPVAVLLLLVAGAHPAAAFEVPEGQSCGGLVCDLGLFGHKTAPKPAPEAAVPAAPAPTAAPVPTVRSEAAEPRRAGPRRKARAAKAIPAPAEKKAAPASVPAPAPAVATAEPPAPRAAPTPVSAPAPVPVTPPPQRSDAVVLANPYVYTKPLPFMFQSIDPNQAVQ